MLKIDSRTKVIWSLSSASFQKFSAEEISKKLIEGPQHAIRAVYTPSMSKILHNLRKELLTSLAATKRYATPEGWFPFVLSFVGRRAVLRVPGPSFAVTLGQELEIDIRVDLESASETSIAKGKIPEIVVSARDMLEKIREGSNLTISYGQVELKILSVKTSSPDILHTVVRVEREGNLLNDMDVHSFDIDKSLFPLLAHDAEAFDSVSTIADYIVVHGIRNEEELLQVKKIILGLQTSSSKRHPNVTITSNIRDANAPMPPRFIFKVDSELSLELLPTVLPHIDGVFLSRSELGLYVHPHTLPILQKDIIATCNQAAKIVIVASELMYSMRVNSTPTRAEVSDLANAVADGADALLFAEEVTEGPFSEEVALVSQETLLNSEKMIEVNWHRVPFEIRNDDDAIAFGALEIAQKTKAKAIVCLTEGGYTALRLASLRTPIEIIAVTYNKEVMRQLSLIRSVKGLVLENSTAFDDVLSATKELLVRQYGFQRRDRIVFVSLTASSVSARNSNLFTLQEID